MDTTKVKKWVGYLNSSNINKKGVLAGMLDECTFEELELIYKRSPQLFKGLLSLSYLKRNNYSQLYGSSIQPRRAVKDYIGVLVYVIKRNVGLINQYVPLKREVDCAVLAGDYDKARELIDSINTKLSYSYWAATSRNARAATDSSFP